jgi:hypothetical protein
MQVPDVNYCRSSVLRAAASRTASCASYRMSSRPERGGATRGLRQCPFCLKGAAGHDGVERQTGAQGCRGVGTELGS